MAQTIPLAEIEANLAVTQVEQQHRHEPIANVPPQILFSATPAVLVLIDGQPVLREAQGTNLMRVINTRSLLLLDQANGNLLSLLDGSLAAGALAPGALASASTYAEPCPTAGSPGRPVNDP